MNPVGDGYFDLYLYIPKYLDLQSNEFNMSSFDSEVRITNGHETLDSIEYFMSKEDINNFSKEDVVKLDYKPIEYHNSKAQDPVTGEKINTREIKILKIRIKFKDFSVNNKFGIQIPIIADLDNEFKDTSQKKSYAKSIVVASKGVNVNGGDVDIEFLTTPIKLSFDLNGGEGNINSQIVAKKSKVEEVESPNKEEAIFAGWYDGKDKFDFSKELTKDTILKAKWEKSYDVLVKHTDLKGKVLKETSLKGKLGEKYTTNEEDIKGYKLKSEPINKDGVFTEDKQDVIYIYEKEKKPTGNSGSGGGNSPVNPSDDSEVIRISGKDRTETAIEFSKKNFSKSKYVIIADGKNFADPLVSTTLAARLKAPILLTVENNIEETVKSEIKRLGAEEIIIVGGPRSVSEDKRTQLKEYDLNQVERVYGQSRYDTSVNLSEKLIKEFDVSKEKVILASGETFADVLSVSPYSIKLNRPILLTTANSLPESVSKYIENKKTEEVLFVGGESTITSSIEENIDKRVKNSKRIAGSNRYETSILIAKEAFATNEKAYITSGEVFADGLVSGAASFKGEEKAVILTPEKSLLDLTRNYIEKSNIKQLIIVGGEKSVGRDVELELRKIMNSKY